MKIISSAPLSGFSRRQGSLYVPDGYSAVPTPQESIGLFKAGAALAKSARPAAVAAGAWKLTTLPATNSHEALTDWLIKNNVSPDKASPYASDLRQFLNNPAVRAVLFGVSGGAATYFVVEKTTWSKRTKWIATVLGAIISAALYLVLRHFGILT